MIRSPHRSLYGALRPGRNLLFASWETCSSPVAPTWLHPFITSDLSLAKEMLTSALSAYGYLQTQQAICRLLFNFAKIHFSSVDTSQEKECLKQVKTWRLCVDISGFVKSHAHIC